MAEIGVTEQEKVWSGEFGDEYIGRNAAEESRLASYLRFWARVLSHASGVDSVFEFGANIGLNLKAIRQLLPNAKMDALEINEKACSILKGIIGNGHVYNQSFQSFVPDRQYDLTFSRGVLIHINPSSIKDCYERLYAASRKYVLVAEYYNPKPVSLPYRGQDGLLFKRDFAGEMMDMFPDLKLLEYGFVYHRDPVFPQDDITWFLLQKA